MENNQSHKSGANSKLYNIEMKGLTLSLHISIWNYPVCFAVTKFPYATSMYLFVFKSDPGAKSDISVVL